MAESFQTPVKLPADQASIIFYIIPFPNFPIPGQYNSVDQSFKSTESGALYYCDTVLIWTNSLV